VTWLWPPYLASGKITLLDGDPQCGKSLITVDLAARLSRAGPLPDERAAAGRTGVLILNAEDDVADTILPRLTAAGADLQHVFVPDKSDLPNPQLPRDLPRLEAMVREAGVGLVVIDPLLAFVPAELAAAGPAIVPHVIRPLAELAVRTRAAVVLVRHLTKRGAAKATHWGLGTVGISGLARTGLLAARDPSRAGHCLLTVAKTNLAEAPPPLAYRVGRRDGVAALEWLGHTDASPDLPIGARPRPEPKGVIRAIDWLLQSLDEGPRPAIELLGAAKTAGIGERTLEKAKYHLGIVSRLQHTRGNHRVWMWHPPTVPPDLDFDPLPELPKFELPWKEDSDSHLSPKARTILNKDKLKWVAEQLKGTQGS
jgi:hypothetical protein